MQHMELAERILKTADEMFRQYGVRSVTMDDLARQMAISKKTLYQYYTDKDELVNRVTDVTIQRIDRDIEIIRTEAKNAVDECIHVVHYFRSLLDSFQPTFLYDLRKYYPEGFRIFTHYREHNIKNNILFNVKRGINEGLYRSDLDPEIVARLRLQQIEGCMDPTMFPPTQFYMADVALQSLRLFLYGLVTPKGHRLLERYLGDQSKIYNA